MIVAGRAATARESRQLPAGGLFQFVPYPFRVGVRSRGRVVQETQCPQCGEWLGVPPEFADRPVRCGACGRVIAPHERGRSAPSPPPPDPRPAGPRFPDRDDDSYSRPPRKGGLLWVVGVLGLLAVGCCGCGGLLFLIAASNPKWEPYSPDSGAFTADFPGKPEHKTEGVNWPDGKEGTAEIYALVRPLNADGFAIHYVDLPKSWQVPKSEDWLLKEGLEQMKKDTTNFTVGTTSRLKVDKYEALDVEGTMTDPKAGLIHVYIRVMIVGERVFTLMAAGKDPKKLAPEKEQFFKSFKPADPKEKPADKDKKKEKDK